MRGRSRSAAQTKTRQSRRTLPLPPQLVEALRQHRLVQRKARILAGLEWHEQGLVFTTVTGRPIDPRDHSVHWVRFLEHAGVRLARPHDARRTAARLLLVQGVDQRVVMDMLGWTSPTMAAR